MLRASFESPARPQKETMTTHFCKQSRILVAAIARENVLHASAPGLVTPDPDSPSNHVFSCSYDCSRSRVCSSGQLPDGCRTPSSGVFDSFAPGPESLNMAPKRQCRSSAKIQRFGMVLGSLSKSKISRVLNFDDVEEEAKPEVIGGMEEKEFLEHIYDDLLNAIVSNHLEECIVKKNSFPSPRTPRCAMKRTFGPWDDCPPAPIKPRSERFVASETLGSLCRRLEF